MKGLGYFSISVRRHHDQSNLEGKSLLGVCLQFQKVRVHNSEVEAW